MSPVLKYKDGSTWVDISTAGPQGTIGPVGPAGADSTVPGATGPTGASGAIGPTGPNGPIDILTDVDTSTVAPAVDNTLIWNGTNWVPGLGGKTYAAGAGLVETVAGTFDVGVGTGITVEADTVSLDTVYASTLYVDVAGDTMTGALTVVDPVRSYIDPVIDASSVQYAAPRHYVDELLTVTTVDPVAGVDIPLRDGLQWVVVEVPVP